MRTTRKLSKDGSATGYPALGVFDFYVHILGPSGRTVLPRGVLTALLRAMIDSRRSISNGGTRLATVERYYTGITLMQNLLRRNSVTVRTSETA